VRAATGIADVTFEEILGGTGERGLSYTRVILRPTQREASSLIMTAIYSDVVNGVIIHAMSDLTDHQTLTAFRDSSTSVTGIARYVDLWM
jgi:hypothetical protein